MLVDINEYIKYYSNNWRESRVFCQTIQRDILINMCDTPSSLLVESEEDLYKHLIFFKNLIKQHKIIAQQNWMKWWKFPNYCCWYSCDHMIINAYMHGYKDIITVRNKTYDHDYNILPFVIDWSYRCLLIDPTYEQLATKKLIHAEWVLIKKWSQWKYKTKWANWKNLYPETFVTLYDIQKDPWIYYRPLDDHSEVKNYLEECFNNPVRRNFDTKMMSALI